MASPSSTGRRPSRRRGVLGGEPIARGAIRGVAHRAAVSTMRTVRHLVVRHPSARQAPAGGIDRPACPQRSAEAALDRPRNTDAVRVERGLPALGERRDARACAVGDDRLHTAPRRRPAARATVSRGAPIRRPCERRPARTARTIDCDCRWAWGSGVLTVTRGAVTGRSRSRQKPRGPCPVKRSGRASPAARRFVTPVRDPVPATTGAGGGGRGRGGGGAGGGGGGPPPAPGGRAPPPAPLCPPPAPPPPGPPAGRPLRGAAAPAAGPPAALRVTTRRAMRPDPPSGARAGGPGSPTTASPGRRSSDHDHGRQRLLDL
ncbi:hypothetical protein ACVK0Y_006919 [Methylobacterium sp. PvP092]